MSSTSTRLEPGRLWVVATPIGCLEDITLRALRILRECDTILAEDTRHTRALLSHHAIGTRSRSLHAQSGPTKIARIVEELEAGAKMALVSDAGTPLISDPGAQLVAAAREAGIVVEPIPGPSAVLAALSVAGLRSDSFRFVGFLPRSGARRRRAIRRIVDAPEATVLFESPRRLLSTLAELERHLGPDRPLAVCRELTKLHEEVRRGSAAALIAHFSEGVRGEITLIVQGSVEPEALIDDPQALDAELGDRLRAGERIKPLAKELAARAGISGSEAYARILRLAEASPSPPAVAELAERPEPGLEPER
ncbi:MAG: 16S rRNA (cytidine(1402)-2'-O)-methyltransferase [Myxococcales bacterium]|nr:16S rRNA (cytidine(1402)-2'-O)-methyltransferase [Myxococcales bacterium]